MTEIDTTKTRLWPFALILCPQYAVSGFITVAFPFLAARHGMSIAAIGSIVGIGLLAVPLKIAWTPIVDLCLSLRAWVLLSAMGAALLLTVFMLIPMTPANAVAIGLLAFASHAVGTLSGIAGSGILALTVDRGRMGRASAFVQAGALVTAGLAGGGALWLASNAGEAWAVLASIGFCALALAVLGLPEPHRPHLHENVAGRLRAIGRDLLDIAGNRRGLWVLFAFCMPIGTGCAANLWGGIAGEWHAGPGIVALVTGLGFAGANALGSFLFGYLGEELDRVNAFLGTSLLLIAAAILMAELPRTPFTFATGAMLYGVMLGTCYTAFTALQFDVIGKGAAASKCGLLNALGNLPLAYMPPLLGLVHDRYSSRAMLWFEALTTLAIVAFFALLRPRSAPAKPEAVLQTV